MTRYVAPIAKRARRGRTTRAGRILDSINDQKREEEKEHIGSYAGWGTHDDARAPAGPGEREGPALAPFLRYRSTDRAWRLAFGVLWIPAIIIVVTIEDWMHIPQGFQWLSLGVVFVVFMVVGFLPVELKR